MAMGLWLIMKWFWIPSLSPIQLVKTMAGPCLKVGASFLAKALSGNDKKILLLFLHKLSKFHLGF